MDFLKILAKVLYLILRRLLLPIVWIFKWIGVKPRNVVSTFTLTLCFIFKEAVDARFGPLGVLGMWVVGMLFAFLFLLWGNEFEEA